MVSGFSDLPAVIRAINEGKVFAYVTKPWNAQDLRFKVAKGVEHFRLARQVAHERQLLADLMNSSTDVLQLHATQLRAHPTDEQPLRPALSPSHCHDYGSRGPLRVCQCLDIDLSG